MCIYGEEDYTCLKVTGIKCNECIKLDAEKQKSSKQVKTFKTPKPKFKTRADKRTGSVFEMKNHNNNEALLNDVVNRQTPNSGAGKIKGDQEIEGIISVSEELKTKVVRQARGKETFTVHKSWLDKLKRESIQKEFYYLKFSFHETEDDIYCITEQDIIMAMIKTMVEDRRKANQADKKIKKAILEKDMYKKENEFLKARIAFLESGDETSEETK